MANGNDFKGGSPWGSPPGGGGNGSGRGGQRPPNIDEVIEKIQKLINRFVPGGKSGGSKPIIFGLVLLIAVWAFSGLYRVLPDEQGVVLRFGKFVSTTQPGLNYHIPYPVETVLTPKVTKVNRIDIGFRSASDSGRSSGVGDVPEESLMLTGDQNIADVHFTVLYKIKDAGNFLFKLRNPETTVKDMSESVMREVVGQRDLQFLLTEGRQEVEQVVRNLLQEILDSYNSGVMVQSVQLQSVDPPDQVIDAFDEVQRARQDKDRLVNEANTYLNKIVPNARGEAAKLVENAKAYKEQVVKQAEGVAQNFVDVYNSYKDAKEVTRRRIYLETLREVLEGKNKIILDDTGNGQGVVPYLPLNELNKRNSE